MHVDTQLKQRSFVEVAFSAALHAASALESTSQLHDEHIQTASYHNTDYGLCNILPKPFDISRNNQAGRQNLVESETMPAERPGGWSTIHIPGRNEPAWRCHNFFLLAVDPIQVIRKMLPAIRIMFISSEDEIALHGAAGIICNVVHAAQRESALA